MSRMILGRRIAAAAFALACFLAAATSQARVLVSGIGVHCLYDGQNETGEDEIYVKFNGVRINMGNFTSDTTRNALLALVILPSLPVTGELWEDDGNHWYDGDDIWDAYTVASFKSVFKESNANGFQYHRYTWWFTLSSIT